MKKYVTPMLLGEKVDDTPVMSELLIGSDVEIDMGEGEEE